MGKALYFLWSNSCFIRDISKNYIFSDKKHKADVSFTTK